jgi:glucose/arabinose dehydrogenase
MKGYLTMMVCALVGSFATAQTLNDATLTRETVIASEITTPIAIEFLNPGDPTRFFVIEKDSGRAKLVENGAVTATLLDLPVNNASERGLLGIALDPNFATNNYVYLYYTRSSTGADTNGTTSWTDNRVERYRFTGTALVEPFTLVTFARDLAQNNGPNHDGGVILFGPDGKLYGVTGDLNRGTFGNPRIEQNTGSGSAANVGGIFRLNRDGTIPSDNPFFSHASSSIRRLFAYGIRNSFGMAFDPWTGKLWLSENGPDKYDEINLVGRGFNSGWRKIMGPDSRDATYTENGNTAYNASDLVMLTNAYYDDPKFSWFQPLGVAAIGFAHSARFNTGTRGQMIVGEANFSRLYMLPLNESRNGFVLTGDLADLVADSTTERNLLTWGTSWGVITDIKIGPDGYLYVVSAYGNRVLRIRPNTPPPIIHGKVNLEDYVGAKLNMPLHLELKVNNATVQEIETTLDAFGRYNVRLNAAHSNYTLVAKAGTFLSITQSGINVPSGSFAYVPLTFLYNGDVNGDDVIDDTDMLALLFAFGLGPDYEGPEDLDGDGDVDDVDLLIVLFNFGGGN